MLRVDLLRQLADRVLVGDVADHEGCPPVVLDAFHIDGEGTHIVGLLLDWPFVVSSHGIVVGKVVSASIALVAGAVECAPEGHIVRVLLRFLLRLLVALVVDPVAVYSVFLNFGQDHIRRLPHNIWGPISFHLLTCSLGHRGLGFRWGLFGGGLPAAVGWPGWLASKFLREGLGADKARYVLPRNVESHLEKGGAVQPPDACRRYGLSRKFSVFFGLHEFKIIPERHPAVTPTCCHKYP